MVKYKEKMAFTYNIQSVVPCRKFNIKQNVNVRLLAVQNSQTGCYTIAACFPFEPQEKCMTFKDIFPGLSRTKVNFQDFPGTGIFKKNPRLPRRRENPKPLILVLVYIAKSFITDRTKIQGSHTDALYTVCQN